MRLSDHEKHIILEAVAAEDATARVFVFGSRANDSSKGGDIDIVATKDGHESFVQLIQPQAQELA